MAVTIQGFDGESRPDLLPVIGSFSLLAAATVVVAATETEAVITFTQLKSIQGIVGLTVRTQSSGAVRTNVGLTAAVDGNVLTIGQGGSFDLDSDTCVIDVLVWGKAKLA